MAKKRARPKKPAQTDILKFGQDGARLKAQLPRKKWLAFLKLTQQRGVTVQGALSGAPPSLQERRPDAIRKEAARLVGESYRPVEQELDERQRAAENLAAKRREDELKYAQWMSGEYGKLEAQARAADETLLRTQGEIANDAEAAMQAAGRDSLERMSQVSGAVSDPTQSTALDRTAADAASQQRIATQRQAAAAGVGTGEDVRQVARAAMTANLAAARSAVESSSVQSINEIFKERSKVDIEKAGSRAALVRELSQENRANAQRGEEMAIAAEELGIKRLDIAAQVREADRKYNLEIKKFNLDRWTAKNKALAERAKIQLGYDKIVAADGQKAADRALRKWVEKYKAQQKKASEKDEKKGVSKEEREVYSDVQTARGLVAKLNRDWRAGNSGAIHPDNHRAYLRKEYGISDALIDAASALYRSDGGVNSEVRKALRRLGLKHIGYFYGSAPSNAGSGAADHPRT